MHCRDIAQLYTRNDASLQRQRLHFSVHKHVVVYASRLYSSRQCGVQGEEWACVKPLPRCKHDFSFLLSCWDKTIHVQTPFICRSGQTDMLSTQYVDHAE
jgi:hypothetical protein